MFENNPQFNLVNQAFPHIGVKLTEYWGHESFVAYMQGLLHGTRGGTRRGFPLEILMAIQDLADQHNVAYPQFEEHDDFWVYVESKAEAKT